MSDIYTQITDANCEKAVKAFPFKRAGAEVIFLCTISGSSFPSWLTFKQYLVNFLSLYQLNIFFKKTHPDFVF